MAAPLSAASSRASTMYGIGPPVGVSTIFTISPTSVPAAAAYCPARARAFSRAAMRACSRTASGSSYENEMPPIVSSSPTDPCTASRSAPMPSIWRARTLTSTDAV